MQLADWLGYIETLHPKAWDPGLERVAAVAARLDVVKPAPLIFLVGGTNGKGSVCACIDALCRELGFRTGVTTSPHLLRFNERIVVDGIQAPDEQLCEAFEAIESARGEISLTYFEFAALAALLIFRQSRVDVAILEVGLGGRLDAMNLVEPDVSVITRVAMDHESWLGDSLPAIAAEKAGIMRAGRPCIVGDRYIPAVISERAVETGSQLFLPGVDYHCKNDALSVRAGCETIAFDDLPAANLPVENAAAAVQAVCSVGLRPSGAQVARMFSRTRLAGRFQLIPGKRRTLLDVAHNPDAAAWLRSRLQSLEFGGCHAISGMYADKAYQSVMTLMSDVVDRWYFPALGHSRGLAPEELAASVPAESGSPIATYDKVSTAYEDAVRRTSERDLIVVFGSFPVVASVLECLQVPV